jgi:hypothetical protein
LNLNLQVPLDWHLQANLSNLVFQNHKDHLLLFDLVFQNHKDHLLLNPVPW